MDSPANVEWRPSTTVGIWPIYRKISATSVTTAKHRSRVLFDDKKMWTLDHMRGIEFQSERVAQPDDPEQREEHMAEYRGFAIK